MTIEVKMLTSGRKYKANNTQYDKLESLVTAARDEMRYPCVYHLCSWIHDPEEFRLSKRDLIKLFKRKLRKVYKRTNQNIPDMVVAYSIEFKYTSWAEVEGKDYRSDSFGNDVPFLHIHFYVIADCCSGTRPQSFTTYARQALNDIAGLSKARYFKSTYGEQFKLLKRDFDDTYQKMLYIAKVEQKSPEIPYRSTFGSSRL